MEKKTVRILKFRSIKEENDLAKELDKLQLKKKHAALQHDRTQSAFMKRYSALLQRKNGGLVPKRKKTPEQRRGDFFVTGAKLSNKFDKRVPRRSDREPLTAVHDENIISTTSVGRADDSNVNGTPFTKSSTSLQVPNQSNYRIRVLSRSAPTTRTVDTELPTIREYSRPPHWPVNTDIFPGRYRAAGPDTERQVRKAWSPDLKVSRYHPAAAMDRSVTTVAPSDFIDTFPTSDCQPLRGILIKKNCYSFKLCGKGLDDLQKEIIASARRRSSVPFENKPLSEHMRKSSSGKKHVTFIESQIAGHEADGDNPPRNLSSRFKGLNIVSLMTDIDGSQYIQQQLCRGCPKVFAP